MKVKVSSSEDISVCMLAGRGDCYACMYVERCNSKEAIAGRRKLTENRLRYAQGLVERRLKELKDLEE